MSSPGSVDMVVDSDCGLDVTVQIALPDAHVVEVPPTGFLCHCAETAYAFMEPTQNAEVVIRVVDAPESKSLNQLYRKKAAPTNVLSFPMEVTPEVELDLLGDIIICHPVVKREAQSEQKAVQAHYAHMVTHGVLHLCGYDHQNPQEADIMESLEAEILALSGIENPYL